MPHTLLPARALSAAIVVLLTVGGIVAITGTAHAEELALERARLGTAVAGLATGPATASQSIATTTTLPATSTTATLAPIPSSTAPTATTVVTAPRPTSAPATTAPPTPPPTAAPPAPASGTRDTACEASTLGWMNQTRTDAGLHPLTRDDAIQHISLGWSDEMASTGELAHNPRYSDQVFAVRAEARTAGEIVGWSTGSARAVYDEFLRSPSHRDRILSGAFTATAVGCVRDRADQIWVTVNFWG